MVGLPKHCRNIEKDIPKFNDKNIGNKVHNLLGQICDMYLSQFSNNVSIKITLDEIRKEILYLNENKEKLNKSDKIKLDKFLNNLN